MKVHGSSLSAEKLAREYAERLRESRNGEQAASRATSSSPADSVSVSGEAKLLVKAKAAVEALPEMRDQLVADIRAKIEAGTYTVDAAKVAEKMLES